MTEDITHPQDLIGNLEHEVEPETREIATEYVSGWATDPDFPILTAPVAAASAIYLASYVTGEFQSQDEIADHIGVSETAIQVTHASLAEYNDLDVTIEP